MIRGEPLTVDDLALPPNGTALDRMRVPTLDEWAVALATVRARALSATSATWFDRTRQQIQQQEQNAGFALQNPNAAQQRYGPGRSPYGP